MDCGNRWTRQALARLVWGNMTAIGVRSTDTELYTLVFQATTVLACLLISGMWDLIKTLHFT